MVYRKPGTLIDLERRILVVLIEHAKDGSHGFAIAQSLADGESGTAKLASHGTLYKALGRLRDRGLVSSEWEAPEIAEGEGRPRRRTYKISAAGREALREARFAEGGDGLGIATT